MKIKNLDEFLIERTTEIESISYLAAAYDMNFRCDLDDFGIIYLPVWYVDLLHSYIVWLYRKSDDPIIRGYISEGNLRYALDYVRTVYTEPKTKRSRLVRKEAFIFYNIASKHPFIDGNKRTAIVACNSFLTSNGYSLLGLPFKESYNFITAVAKGEKTEKDCQKFVNRHISKFEHPDTLIVREETLKQLESKMRYFMNKAR